MTADLSRCVLQKEDDVFFIVDSRSKNPALRFWMRNLFQAGTERQRARIRANYFPWR